MTDFFKFRSSLEEVKKNKRDEEKLDPVGKADADIDNDGDVDSSDEYLKKRRKAISKSMKNEDENGPCWKGYKQVGMKMQNGKEVPNCVPEETDKQMDESSRKTEKELSKLMTKALDGKRPKSDYTSEIANNGDFVVKDGGGRVVGRIKKGDFENPMKENVNEGYYDYPDYGPVGASEMAQTQLHFIKYAADDITRCLKMGCPMPEWYQNKLAKIEGDMEGLYSYMKGKTRKMKAHHADRYSMSMRMYGEETITEEKKGDDDGYDEFFQAALKKFGVKGIGELDKEKKKEFFNYVDKNWKADDEKNESVQIDEKVNMKDLKDTIKKYNDQDHRSAFHYPKKKSVSVDGRGMSYDDAMEKMKDILGESYITEKLKPSDDVSKWIEDFYKSDAPQFKGKDKEERREMAVAAWLDARREAGYDVEPNPNDE